MHTTGEWIAGTVSAKPAKEDAQTLGSLISYLRRYALSAIVGGYAVDDDAEADRQAHEDRQAYEQTKKTFHLNHVGYKAFEVKPS